MAEGAAGGFGDGGLGFVGGEAFVDQVDGEVEFGFQEGGEFSGFGGFGAFGVVHVEGEAEDDGGDAALGDVGAEGLHALGGVGVRERGQGQGDAEFVGVAEADTALAVVYAEIVLGGGFEYWTGKEKNGKLGFLAILSG
jgi:hypothetical protein